METKLYEFLMLEGLKKNSTDNKKIFLKPNEHIL